MEFCFVIVLDTVQDKRLCAALHSRLEYHVDRQSDPRVVKHVVRVFNETTTPRPFQVYQLADLDGLWSKRRYLALRFRSPRHQILARADDPVKVTRFVKVLTAAIKGLRVRPSLDGSYDPPMARYTSPECFDRRDSNFSHVSTLVLEHCAVPELIVGPAPIAHISLSDSTLGANEAERECFFDWMTSDAVTSSLEVLEMNNCQLDKLPYQLLYLQKLNTLSVARNKLKILPYFLGELKNLENLYANDNLLRFLPGSLQCISFYNFNVSKNKFDCPVLVNQTSPKERFELQAKNYPVCSSLALISFYSLFTNCVIKRQHFPHTMWFLFDEVKRCSSCKRLVMADSCFEVYDKTFANTLKLSNNNPIPWQFFECKYKCSFNINYLDLKLSLKDASTTTLVSRLRQMQLRIDLISNKSGK